MLACPLYQETVAGGLDQTMQEMLTLQPTLACTTAVSASTSGGSANIENGNGNKSIPIQLQTIFFFKHISRISKDSFIRGKSSMYLA